MKNKNSPLPEEKSSSKSINHNYYIYGDAPMINSEGSIQIQNSVTNSSLSLIESSNNLEIITELLGLINQIQTKSDSKNLTSEQKLEIETILESLKKEIISTKPKQTLLKKLWNQLKQKAPSAVSFALQFVELLDKLGIKT